MMWFPAECRNPPLCVCVRVGACVCVCLWVCVLVPVYSCACVCICLRANKVSKDNGSSEKSLQGNRSVIQERLARAHADTTIGKEISEAHPWTGRRSHIGINYMNIMRPLEGDREREINREGCKQNNRVAL